MQRVTRRTAIRCNQSEAAAPGRRAVCRLPGADRRDKVWPRRRGIGMDSMSLGRTAANFAPLSPLGFLPRSAAIYPDRVAMVHGDRRIVYREFDLRARRLASALARRGVGPGDTVWAGLPGVPAMLEAAFGVARTGAVLTTLIARPDARTLAD